MNRRDQIPGFLSTILLLGLAFCSDGYSASKGTPPSPDRDARLHKLPEPQIDRRKEFEDLLKNRASLLPPPPDNSGYFGPEFTFFSKKHKAIGLPSYEDTQVRDWERNIIDSWKASLAKRCANCVIVEHSEPANDGTDYHRPFLKVHYPQQGERPPFQVRVEFDQGVIEVVMSGMTPTQFNSVKNIVQRDVFDLAAQDLKVGGEQASFTPGRFAGGGHIHVDIQSTLRDSPLLVRNMVVDLQSHPAMFLGGIAVAYQESPVAIEPKSSQDKFSAALKKFDSQLELGMDKKAGMLSLAQLFSERRDPALKSQGGQTKSHLVNIQHLDFSGHHATPNSPYTIEIRGFNPQKDANTYELQIELINARARYLEKIEKPIPYTGNIRPEDLAKIRLPGSEFIDPKLASKGNPLNPQQSADEFYSFVKECGLDWNRFKPLLHPEVAKLIPTPLAQDLHLFLKEQLHMLCNSYPGQLVEKIANCKTQSQKALKQLAEHYSMTQPCPPKVSPTWEHTINELHGNLLKVFGRLQTPQERADAIKDQFLSLGFKMGLEENQVKDLLQTAFKR